MAFVTVASLSIENRPYLGSILKTTDPYPTINWEYGFVDRVTVNNQFVVEAASATAAGYELRIGTAATALGTDSFSGDIVNTGFVSGTVLGYRYRGTRLFRGHSYWGQLRLTDSISGSEVSEWFPFTFQYNSIPQVPTASITPASPEVGDSLLLSYTFSDTDGDTDESIIWWYRNGIHEPQFDNLATIESEHLVYGDIWAATVFPFDGYEIGPSKSTSAVTITKTAPTASGLSIEPTNPTSVDPLYAKFEVAAGTEQYSTIRWYVNNVLQTDKNTRFVRLEIEPGDEVKFEVKASDGEADGGFQQSSTVTIGTPPFRVIALTVDNEKAPLSVASLTPTISWGVVGPSTAHTKVNVLIGTAPRSSNIYEIELTGPVTLFSVPADTLTSGVDYYISVAAGDDDGYGAYTVTHFRTAGSLWATTVDNTTGWTIELTAKIETTSEGSSSSSSSSSSTSSSSSSSSSSSFVLGTEYHGIRIYDGTYYCEVRLYTDLIALLPDESFTYASADLSNYSVITIVGQGTSVKVYKNYQLVLSTTLTKSTSDKYIEVGAIGTAEDTTGSYLNLYYTTSGDYEPSSSTQYYETVYSDFFETKGSVDYITGYAGEAYFAVSAEDEDESSSFYRISDYKQPIEVSPSANASNVAINSIDSTGPITYVSHDLGATLIDSYLIPAYDSSATFSTQQLASNWAEFTAGGTKSYSVSGLRINTTGDNGKLFFHHSRPGTRWFDGVDNARGWTIEFSVSVATVTDDFSSSNLTVPDGCGIFISDGAYCETIHLHTQEIFFEGSGLSIVQDNTVLRDYVITGKDNTIRVYSKLVSSESYTLIGETRLNRRGTIEANGGRPDITESNGVAHTVWHDDGGGFQRLFYASTDASVEDDKYSKWTYPVCVVSDAFGAAHPSIAADSENRVFIAYESQRNDGTDIGFVMKNRFGWSSPRTLVAASLRSKNPKIAIDSADHLHLVWEDYRNQNPQIYYAKRNGVTGDWSEPVKITSEAFGAVRPSIDCDDTKVYVSYTSQSINGTSAICGFYQNAGIWSSKVTFSLLTRQADFSDILSQDGRIYVAWDDAHDEDYEIYVRRYDAALSPLSDVIKLTTDNTASRFPRLGVHTGADFDLYDVVVVFESGGDLSPYSGSFFDQDTISRLCYYDFATDTWYSSNQTGGFDVTLYPPDLRYSRRPVLPKRFAADAHIVYETDPAGSFEYAEYGQGSSEGFTAIFDAVYDRSIIPYYYLYGDDIDVRVSGQYPRREIRFGDFSDARNIDMTFGYFKYYVGDAVAPFSIGLISSIGECVQSTPNARGDAWLVGDGLRFFNRATSELAAVSLTSFPQIVRFDRNSRMHVLTDEGIFYSDDHYTFGSAAIEGENIVDFAFDSQNNLWMLTAQHLLKYENYSLKGIFSVKDALLDDDVVCSKIVIDASDAIWVCSDGGLACLRNGKFATFSTFNSGIPSDAVNDVAIRSNAIRYVATNAGVAKMTSNTFEKIHIDDPDWIEECSALEWVNPGILWAAGNSRLLQILVAPDETYSLVSYSAATFANYQQTTCVLPGRYDFGYTAGSDILVEVLVNGRVVKRGYTISGTKIKFDSPLLPTDEILVRIREDITNFGTLQRNRAEKELFGDQFRQVAKMAVDGERIYASLSGDVDQLVAYNVADTSVVPYDKIVFDSTPPFGNLVFERLTSSRRIVQLAIESFGDNLSGLKEMIVANRSNLTSDGTTALTWQPFQERFLHDLGSDLGNVTTQLTFDVGTGKRIAKFGTTLYAGSAGPAKIYRLNTDTNKWADVEAFEDEEADTVIEFMIQYKQAMIVGTSSATSGGKLWKTANGTTYELLATLAAAQPKCATILNGNLYIGTGGTNGGQLYRYNNVRIEVVFASPLGSEVSSLTFNKDFLYAGTTGAKGFLYRLTTDVAENPFRATVIYIDSSPKISAIAAVTLAGQTSVNGDQPSDDQAIFAANGSGGRIVKSLNGNAFGTSFYTLPVQITQMKIDEFTGLLHSTVGNNVYKYKNRTWQPIFTNTEVVEDIYLGELGFYAISASGVKFFDYEQTKKKVYLALRDVAGNATQEPGTEATNDGTALPFIEIGIEELTGFVNANRVLELDEYGVEVFSYDGEAPFYSADKVETERAEYWSEIFNGTSDHVSWDIIYWDAIVPEGCDFKVYVRSGTSKTSILDEPFLKQFDKEDFEGGDISSLSGQYIQFKVVMSSTIRDKTPRLYAVNIRGLARSSVHFFTTNFTLPSRILRGILTADTFVPVAADVVFGINTSDSTDFSDYQIIEPNRMFTMSGDQIGQNLRVGVKLISPLSQTVETDPIYEYDEYASEFRYHNVVDFDLTNYTGDEQTYNFKVELYEDYLMTTLAATLYSGSDPTAWSVNNTAIDSTGYTVANGETVSVLVSVKGNAAIRCNEGYYAKVYYQIGTTDTLITDENEFLSTCNPTFYNTATFQFTNEGASGLFNFRAKFYEDSARTILATKEDGTGATYYSGLDATGWEADEIGFSELGQLITTGETQTITFTPPTNDLAAGIYYMTVSYFRMSGSSFEKVSNSYWIRIPETTDFSCGEYSDVPVVKNIALLFELEDYVEKFGSRERVRRTIQLNL